MSLTPDEFESVYTAYAHSLINFMARLVGRDEAYDLSQEVFLRFYSAKIPDRKVKPWLYQVAYRICIDHWRKKKTVRINTFDQIPESGSAAVDPEAAYLDKEFTAHFARVFNGMPPEYRALLLLRSENRASYREIAAITGLSLESVRSRLYRARMALHRALITGKQGENIDQM